ncbi:alanine racemase [Chthonomonas calidirosea]|uniref:alanine racemase n=1 Tax=Chthonomonas calidirosea TaxID=454171 RepID=UPI0006DD3AC1|nr:alanine racemase [Chthonomonas calidirosea]CEK17705.1 alanine racemase [Chthonomonas calidirosea]
MQNGHAPAVAEDGKTRAWATVHLAAIRANIATLRRIASPSKEIMAVVKADAYGHGLLAVAKAALEAGVQWLGVATVEEGRCLRRAGITCPIALLCVPAPQEAEWVVQYNLTPLIGSEDVLRALVAAGCREAHLEVDTGMGRAGVLPEEATALWRLAQSRGLAFTGLGTHFADAENPQDELSQKQLECFHWVRSTLEKAGARFRWIHSANSAALLAGLDSESNLVRPGLLVYGILPSTRQNQLWRTQFLPALQLEASIGTVRELPQGHSISYGATHRLTRPSRVATALIGYGDGYPRRLSNQGYMLVHGQKAPILGRICMDQTVLDVTEIPFVQSGDVAVAIGKQGTECLFVEELAKSVGTTEHEITTCLTQRIPRFFEP